MTAYSNDISSRQLNSSSHLVNNGVQETPPSQPSANGTSGATARPDPNSLFINLEQNNVGFRHWHPVAVTEKGSNLCGQSAMGGVWEWTSTILQKHQGYEPMSLYPGYSCMCFPSHIRMTC